MIKMVPKPSSTVRIGSDPLMMVSQIGCDPEVSFVELYMAKKRNPTIARGSSIFELLTCQRTNKQSFCGLANILAANSNKVERKTSLVYCVDHGRPWNRVSICHCGCGRKLHHGDPVRLTIGLSRVREKTRLKRRVAV